MTSDPSEKVSNAKAFIKKEINESKEFLDIDRVAAEKVLPEWLKKRSVIRKSSLGENFLVWSRYKKFPASKYQLIHTLYEIIMEQSSPSGYYIVLSEINQPKSDPSTPKEPRQKIASDEFLKMARESAPPITKTEYELREKEMKPKEASPSP